MSHAQIYCDESGFTGNNLLHPEQPIFSYSSVVTSEDEAKEHLERIRRNYGLQGEELKGSRLTRSRNGRKAILDTLRVFEGRVRLSVVDKKYALATKFFEYIFEPCVSQNNALLYSVDFHRFVSNVLYMEFTARGAGAEDLFVDFERLMRSKSFVDLETLLGSSIEEMSPVLTQIREFAISNQDAITEELSALPGDGAGKWVLDLTNSSLHALLADWGQHYDEMTVFCDQSKPLQHDAHMFTVMIGRTDKQYITTSTGKHPLTFNLTGPLELVDSKTHLGIQVADLAAAAGAYSYDTSNEDDLADYVNQNREPLLSDQCIFPNFDYIDLSKVEVLRNAFLLMELHKRAVGGRPLLDGLGEYLQLLTVELINNPPRLEN